MDSRVTLTSSADIPVNSPVLKMREFEFQVAAMHRENDELRAMLDKKNQEIARLQEEKSRFEFEQEEAERRYMELEDRFIELERQLKKGGITSPAAQVIHVIPQQSTSAATVSASSSPFIHQNANISPLTASQAARRPSSSLSASTSINRADGSNENPAFSLSYSQAIQSPLAESSTIQNSNMLSSSTSVVPNLSSSSRNNKNLPPASPTLTSCVVDSSHLEVSVVPSPTPQAKKHRKKSIISLFSL